MTLALLAAFVGMWTLMMAAMMLPSVSPAFLLTALVARLVDDHPGWATAVAVAVFAACGLYQLTPLKSRRLKHCRSPLSLFVVVGVMNLAAMVVLAAVVLAEKLWAHGELLARIVGIAALALAVAVIWAPALAPGLHGTGQMMDMASATAGGTADPEQESANLSCAMIPMLNRASAGRGRPQRRGTRPSPDG